MEPLTISNPMNNNDPKTSLLEVFSRCQKTLPRNAAGNLVIVGSDPRPLKKKETDIMRLRVLPRQKSPIDFWNSAWCFYEVGFGVYDGALTVGGVLFVQFPFQK